MSNVKMPIQTVREGNKITKVCVEDVYKMINRIIEPIDKLRNGLDDFEKEYEYPDGSAYRGDLVIGTGVSQPCIGDAFDEEIGMNLAFIKSKLNANIKKYRFLLRAQSNAEKVFEAISEELDRVYDLIEMDLEGVRKHNPEFNPTIV